MIQLGHVREIARYPVKSMAGIAIESAFLGWHGLAGDRRFAFRRLGDETGFPWLNASRLAVLLLYHPRGLDESSGEPLPTHVRTPDGRELELRSGELEREIAEHFGSSVELMKLKHGIFDDASVSVISLTTIAAIGAVAGVDLDRRRFRANIVLDTHEADPFLEDAWVGGTLLFGDRDPRPAVSVTARDVRCMMINLDPDTATQDPRVLKAAVRSNENNAGVYGTVVQTGVIAVGQAVFFEGRRERSDGVGRGESR
ncbi:MAG TPA: MOSC domain-containing protein [Thermoanaerobaculia bacterium]|nr:MOSC domain-containing protein [Thermoanaerobaculia bacterium]